jgi:hypothetical protein
MARTYGEKPAAAVAYYGEIWTDGRGHAVIVLPAEARELRPPLAYTLEPSEPLVAATVTAELGRPVRHQDERTARQGRLARRQPGQPRRRNLMKAFIALLQPWRGARTCCWPFVGPAAATYPGSNDGRIGFAATVDGTPTSTPCSPTARTCAG